MPAFLLAAIIFWPFTVNKIRKLLKVIPSKKVGTTDGTVDYFDGAGAVIHLRAIIHDGSSSLLAH